MPYFSPPTLATEYIISAQPGKRTLLMTPACETRTSLCHPLFLLWVDSRPLFCVWGGWGIIFFICDLSPSYLCIAQWYKINFRNGILFKSTENTWVTQTRLYGLWGFLFCFILFLSSSYITSNTISLFPLALLSLRWEIRINCLARLKLNTQYYVPVAELVMNEFSLPNL